MMKRVARARKKKISGPRGEGGFTLAEFVSSIVICVIVMLLASTLVSLMQWLNKSITLAQTKEGLIRRLYNASFNQQALKEAILHNPVFAACFVPGSNNCPAGVTQNLTLYDANSEAVAGPGQDAETGQPIIYDIRGAVCPGLKAATSECPIAIVASFEAQSYPSFICLNAQCSDSAPNPPPAGGLTPELLHVRYVISFAPIPRMPVQRAISGSYVIDMKNTGL